MWAAVLVVGLALFGLSQLTVVLTGNPRLLPAMVLIGALAAPATCVAFIWTRAIGPSGIHVVDPMNAVGVGLVGGALGVVIAALSEHLVSRAVGVAPPLAVAVIEELAKLVVPAIVIIRTRPTAAAGLALGVASGAGFALLETLGYAFVAYLQSGDTLSALDSDLLSRSLFTPATHLAWTGIAAAAFAVMRAAPKARSVAAFVAATVVVVLLHTIWDTWSVVGVYVVLSVVSIGLLLGALYVARRLSIAM